MLTHSRHGAARSPRTTRPWLAAAPVLALLLAVAGCGGSGGSSGGGLPLGGSDGSTAAGDPSDLYRDFVQAVEGDDLASFKALLSPGFFGVEADLPQCDDNDVDASDVLSCLVSASKEGDLNLPAASDHVVSIRDEIGKQYSGQELDQQITGLLKQASAAVGETLEEDDAAALKAPGALGDGSELSLAIVHLAAGWRIYGIE